MNFPKMFDILCVLYMYYVLYSAFLTFHNTAPGDCHLKAT